MEAKQVVWTRRASIQLESAQSYIAADAPFAADAFLDSVLELVEELMEYPEIGRMIPEYENPNYRERIFGHYRIMYAFEDVSSGFSPSFTMLKNRQSGSRKRA